MNVFDYILDTGFAPVFLNRIDAAKLDELYLESVGFFDNEESTKMRYSTPRHLVGYRPFGQSYTYSSDRKSLNDTFIFWPNRCRMLEHREDIAEFLHAFAEYLPVVEAITRNFLTALGDLYGRAPLKFENASFLQINSYTQDLEEDLIHHPHEDGVLLTIIWTSAPGLHLECRTGTRPVTPAGNELLLMPGSILTAMTGGRIPPTRHYLRNFRHLGRKSIMYFVSSNVDSEIDPYVVNNENSHINIRELSVNNPQAFGLPPDFITAPID